MEWFWILWTIVSVISACVFFFLAAIDVVENNLAILLTICIIIFPFGIFALVLTVCVVVFPVGIFLLVCISLVELYNFLNKHKDKIRKFLRIKD